MAGRDDDPEIAHSSYFWVMINYYLNNLGLANELKQQHSLDPERVFSIGRFDQTLLGLEAAENANRTGSG